MLQLPACACSSTSLPQQPVNSQDNGMSLHSNTAAKCSWHRKLLSWPWDAPSVASMQKHADAIPPGTDMALKQIRMHKYLCIHQVLREACPARRAAKDSSAPQHLLYLNTLKARLTRNVEGVSCQPADEGCQAVCVPSVQRASSAMLNMLGGVAGTLLMLQSQRRRDVVGWGHVGVLVFLSLASRHG